MSTVGPRTLFAWRDRTLSEPAHDARSASILGIALGVSFTLCFVTGLWSHLAQDPDAWFALPTCPSWGYRVTQGTHVISGTASIPLLLAKLWTVYPHLFQPPARRFGPLVERLSLVPLVAGSLLLLFTGWVNVTRWYPWEFFFPDADYWTAWTTMGALVIHVGAKIATVVAALPPHETDDEVSTDHADDRRVASAPPRRAVLWWAFGSSAAITVVTAGQTVTWLRNAVLFAPRRGDISVQGVPINKTAEGAGVVVAANDPDWRLAVEHEGRILARFSAAELGALPQRRARLPIACVEGWSASAIWTGVAMTDLLAAAKAPTDRDVRVDSLEQGGLYSSSQVHAKLVRDADTLVALQINDETLHQDHGYPARLIAPNRPGVLQTKWLARVVVL